MTINIKEKTKEEVDTPLRIIYSGNINTGLEIYEEFFKLHKKASKRNLLLKSLDPDKVDIKSITEDCFFTVSDTGFKKDKQLTELEFFGGKFFYITETVKSLACSVYLEDFQLEAFGKIVNTALDGDIILNCNNEIIKVPSIYIWDVRDKTEQPSRLLEKSTIFLSTKMSFIKKKKLLNNFYYDNISAKY